ncbi:hypothetical protein [Azospirillum argentinense]
MRSPAIHTKRGRTTDSEEGSRAHPCGCRGNLSCRAAPYQYPEMRVLDREIRQKVVYLADYRIKIVIINHGCVLWSFSTPNLPPKVAIVREIVFWEKNLISMHQRGGGRQTSRFAIPKAKNFAIGINPKISRENLLISAYTE